MRYVPAYCLREGMIVANNVYSPDGVVLLAKDVILTESYIESIQKLLINGLYITDSLSENITIEQIISEELRIGAIKSIKEVYNNPKTIVKTIHTVENIAKDIIGEILRNRSIVVNMIDIKTYDDFTYSHSVNVAVLSTVIGMALNFDTKKLEKLTASALLHDIGKVFIPKTIINKTAPLTMEEEEIIKSHAEKGYRYIKSRFNIAVTSYVGILQHHEQYDGKGYPDHRVGEEISIFGRIISLCNAYDNLISERPNQKSIIPSEAIEYIMANNGIRFDPKLVKIFLRKISPYPLGTIVELSNEEKAIVIENNEECSIRPKVKTIKDGKIYDMTYDWNLRNVTITGVANM